MGIDHRWVEVTSMIVDRLCVDHHEAAEEDLTIIHEELQSVDSMMVGSQAVVDLNVVHQDKHPEEVWMVDLSVDHHVEEELVALTIILVELRSVDSMMVDSQVVVDLNVVHQEDHPVEVWMVDLYAVLLQVVIINVPVTVVHQEDLLVEEDLRLTVDNKMKIHAVEEENQVNLVVVGDEVELLRQDSLLHKKNLQCSNNIKHHHHNNKNRQQHMMMMVGK